MAKHDTRRTEGQVPSEELRSLEYDSQVLYSGWNPALAELCSRRSERKTASRPRREVCTESCYEDGDDP